jgi:hypothetical protein
MVIGAAHAGDAMTTKANDNRNFFISRHSLKRNKRTLTKPTNHPKLTHSLRDKPNANGMQNSFKSTQSGQHPAVFP